MNAEKCYAVYKKNGAIAVITLIPSATALSVMCNNISISEGEGGYRKVALDDAYE